MKVEVWFQRSSQPVKFDKAYATYQKGDLFCVAFGDTRDKFPLAHIWKIRESEFYSSQSNHRVKE